MHPDVWSLTNTSNVLIVLGENSGLGYFTDLNVIKMRTNVFINENDLWSSSSILKCTYMHVSYKYLSPYGLDRKPGNKYDWLKAF